MPRILAARASFSLALAFLLPAAAAADTAGQVFDLWPGSDPGVPSFDAAVFAGELCFRGRNAFTASDATGDELYCYDGTTVTLAADILPGATGSFPRELTVYDGQLYFSAENPFDDNELWRWDGVNPPEEVFDLQPGGESAPRELTIYDGQLYFSAADDGASGGRALWRYDSSQPTAIGTNPMLVQDFSTTDLDTPSDWLVFDGVLFYPAPPGTGHGPELFRFDSSQPIVDGTNPRILVDLNAGLPGSDPRDLTAHSDGNFYFTAVTTGDVGRRLYRSNGNNVPTPLSATLDIQGDLGSYGGDLLFFAQNQDPGDLTGTELWSYDGTIFTRVEPGVEYILGGPFGEIDGFLYFVAPQGNVFNGFDLYKVDGTNPPAPAISLFSIIGDDNYPVFGFQPFGGLLYFNARSSAGGTELWALEAEGVAPPSSGAIEFGTLTYSADEAASNALVNFFRNGGTAGAISACFATSDGSADEDDDYEAVSITISFADGAQAPVTVPIPLLDDNVFEGDETVVLTLSTGGPCGNGPIGAPTATLTILEDEAPPTDPTIHFSAAAYTVGEDDGVATITLTRSGLGGSACVTVEVLADSATADNDYVAVAPFGVTWGPMDTAPKTFDITILQDTDVEMPETVDLEISGGILGGDPFCSAVPGTPSSAVLSIVDDDGVIDITAIPTVSEWGLLLFAACLALLALPKSRG
jgi:ELWxxDGT repeat protein